MKIVLDLQGAQSDSRFRGIGRYSLALSEAIAREGPQHELWVALNGRFPGSIEPLRARFEAIIPRERICVFQIPGPVAELEPANAWRMQAAELARESFLAGLQPDLVHMSTLFEGFHNEVVASIGRLDSSVPTAVTLYDLIPLLEPDRYLSRPGMRRAYLRRAQSLKQAGLLLAISESSRREAIEKLRIPGDRIINIAAGADPSFYRLEISPEQKSTAMRRFGLQRPFVLYTGGLEPRKNLAGLIAAFSLLPEVLRTGYQLAVAGRLYQGEAERIAKIARQHGLADHDVVCVGYTSDEDLRILYNTCVVFVFPSFHEGFGLPLVEAMACGAPVLGSNCTSIPEIINRPDALFDPRNAGDLAERLKNVLANAGLRQDLAEWGQQRARAFTWQASARTALDAFAAFRPVRAAASSTAAHFNAASRPQLAFIAPPPAETGSAAFSTELLANLTGYYEITCVVDHTKKPDPWITANFAVRDAAWFETHAARFDRILYWFGDGPVLPARFDLLRKHPGVVALPEVYLGNLWRRGIEPGEASRALRKMLYESHGYPALVKEQSAGEGALGIFPCHGQVLRDGLGAIVQDDAAFEITRRWFGDRALDRLRLVAPLPLAPDPAKNHPEQAARQYADALENFSTRSDAARESRLIKAIARIPTTVGPAEADLRDSALALASNRTWFGWPQILVDITILAKFDARTGIQRVTRGILRNLLLAPPPGYRIEPVRAVAGGYAYARSFTCRCLGLADAGLPDDPVEIGRADTFLGLDWCADVVPPLSEWFREHRRRGLRMIFVAYDVLPLVHPTFFPPGMASVARDWIRTVAEIADGVVCISRTVADELHQWLNGTGWERLRPMGIGSFHLGADLHASLPSTGLPEGAADLLAKLRSRPSFLAVGTLEPRKGHRQVLAAMELLWSKGVDVNLVIIGKTGWMMNEFAEGLRQHAESGRRLFWLPGVSDEMLEQVYRSAHALIAASEAEGFGLPLIEAAQYGLPIIARNLPVFQEVAGGHAYYFDGQDPVTLAGALRSWLALGKAVPGSSGMPWQTWEQSAKQLIEVVLEGPRQHRWPDRSGAPKVKPGSVGNLVFPDSLE
ncbi:MAG: glycosyltransferase family 4 protein [Verrucomicrobia bacterium]|nr:glycosyltransferase family 4 protein [Verrucomicrobiota bacterium]